MYIVLLSSSLYCMTPYAYWWAYTYRDPDDLKLILLAVGIKEIKIGPFYSFIIQYGISLFNCNSNHNSMH